MRPCFVALRNKFRSTHFTRHTRIFSFTIVTIMWKYEHALGTHLITINVMCIQTQRYHHILVHRFKYIFCLFRDIWPASSPHIVIQRNYGAFFVVLIPYMQDYRRSTRTHLRTTCIHQKNECYPLTHIWGWFVFVFDVCIENVYVQIWPNVRHIYPCIFSVTYKPHSMPRCVYMYVMKIPSACICTCAHVCGWVFFLFVHMRWCFNSCTGLACIRVMNNL